MRCSKFYLRVVWRFSIDYFFGTSCGWSNMFSIRNRFYYHYNILEGIQQYNIIFPTFMHSLFAPIESVVNCSSVADTYINIFNTQCLFPMIALHCLIAILTCYCAAKYSKLSTSYLPLLYTCRFLLRTSLLIVLPS